MRRRTRLVCTATLAVSALTTAAVTMVNALPAQAATTCEPFGSITQGKYWLNNNLWGQDSGSGQQCVTDNYLSGDTIGWSTDWTWSGGPSDVKSFVSAVLGWHWGWQVDNTGLPVQLSGPETVTSSWDYQVSTNPGTMNVAYDLWLHEISNPTWEHNPTDEIMIWPYTAGGAGPIGGVVDTLTIDGVTWNLHRGNIGWNVFSFVATDNHTSVDLNLSSFLDDLIGRGWVPASKYLTSVQAGTEVFHGSGTLTTDAYSVTIDDDGDGGPTDPPGDGDCAVGYSVNDWGSGFTGNVTVTNTGNGALSGWTVGWTWPGDQQVNQAWSAQVSQSGSAVTASNMSYNGSLAAGQSTSFGFNASYTGGNPAPTDFTCTTT